MSLMKGGYRGSKEVVSEDESQESQAGLEEDGRVKTEKFGDYTDRQVEIEAVQG